MSRPIRIKSGNPESRVWIRLVRVNDFRKKSEMAEPLRCTSLFKNDNDATAQQKLGTVVQELNSLESLVDCPKAIV
jgi:hypothetical protein